MFNPRQPNRLSHHLVKGTPVQDAGQSEVPWQCQIATPQLPAEGNAELKRKSYESTNSMVNTLLTGRLTLLCWNGDKFPLGIFSQSQKFFNGRGCWNHWVATSEPKQHMLRRPLGFCAPKNWESKGPCTFYPSKTNISRPKKFCMDLQLPSFSQPKNPLCHPSIIPSFGRGETNPSLAHSCAQRGRRCTGVVQSFEASDYQVHWVSLSHETNT